MHGFKDKCTDSTMLDLETTKMNKTRSRKEADRNQGLWEPLKNDSL